MADVDRYLPDPDVVERHRISVDASVERTWTAVEDADLAGDGVAGVLLALRGMRRGRSMRVRDFERFGFVRLPGSSEREIVLGLVGRFWRPSGGVVRVAPEDFVGFDRPGYMKAVWNVRAEAAGKGAVVSTETRVAGTDARARWLFRPYWLVVRPFSGLIRRRLLKLVKTGAEGAG